MFLCALGLVPHYFMENAEAEQPVQMMKKGEMHPILTGATTQDVDPYNTERLEGYNSPEEWLVAIREKRAEVAEKISSITNTGNLTNEEEEKLNSIKDKHINTFADADGVIAVADEIIESIQSRVKVPSRSYGGFYRSGVLNMRDGINQYNGRTESWYSSRDAYHKDTAQWTAGPDGVYRDRDGYIVVADRYNPKGSLIDTSLGMGKVYDWCEAGRVDIYVNW